MIFFWHKTVRSIIYAPVIYRMYVSFPLTLSPLSPFISKKYCLPEERRHPWLPEGKATWQTSETWCSKHMLSYGSFLYFRKQGFFADVSWGAVSSGAVSMICMVWQRQIFLTNFYIPTFLLSDLLTWENTDWLDCSRIASYYLSSGSAGQIVLF